MVGSIAAEGSVTSVAVEGGCVSSWLACVCCVLDRGVDLFVCMQIYLDKMECLIHNATHSSNWLSKCMKMAITHAFSRHSLRQA